MPWLRIDADLDLDPKIRRAGFWSCAAFEAVLRRCKLGSGHGRLPADRADADALAELRGVPPAQVADFRAGLARCYEVGLLARDAASGDTLIPNWPKFQEDPTAADRQSRFRERNASNASNASNGDSRNDRYVTEVTTTGQDGTGRDKTRQDQESEPALVKPPVPVPVGTAPRAKSSQEARKPNGLDVVLEAYRRAYVRTYGQEPAITPADRSQVGYMLNGSRPADIAPALWPAKLAHLADRYLADQDKFVAAAGHPLRLLSTRLSALSTAGRGPATQAPTCPQCGEPLGAASVNSNRGRVHLGCRDGADAPEETA